MEVALRGKRARGRRGGAGGGRRGIAEGHGEVGHLVGLQGQRGGEGYVLHSPVAPRHVRQGHERL